MRIAIGTILFLLFVVDVNLSAQANSDLKNFNSGGAKVYSSKEDGKTLSTEFSINYLSSWSTLGIPDKIVVKSFSKIVDSKTVAYRILILPLNRPPTKEEILGELEGLNSLPAGFNVISNDANNKVAGLPAALTQYYSDSTSKNSRKVCLYFYTYSFFHKSDFIQIQCSVGGDKADAASIKEMFESYKPFFEAVSKTFLIY